MVWFYPPLSKACSNLCFILSIPLWSDFIQTESAAPLRSRSAFNPTMVWFYHNRYSGEILDDNTIIIYDTLFQSHYGLILSRDEQRTITDILYFQSHYGLILSTSARKSLKNSTRLSIPLWSDFISSGVSSIEFSNLAFQSHYGLILSARARSLQHKLNSNLSIPLWSDFIMKLVQHLQAIKVSFNPTMVWFYHFLRSTENNFRNDFQSHYGLILSYTRNYFTVWERGLSIPLWSDFINKIISLINQMISNFQSHYGLILSYFGYGWQYRGSSLSIPLWSDFIQKNVERYIKAFTTFNPTMVWFYRKLP